LLLRPALRNRQLLPDGLPLRCQAGRLLQSLPNHLLLDELLRFRLRPSSLRAWLLPRWLSDRGAAVRRSGIPSASRQ
jgi:hypothetical protein